MIWVKGESLGKGELVGMTQTEPLLAHTSNCVYCAARPLGVCGALGDGEAFRELRDSRRAVRILDAGLPIYRQGDPSGDLFNLVTGWVVQYQDLEDGRRQILRFLVPGALFGYEPTGVKGMCHGAEALTNASLCVVPAARMTELRHRHPAFNERFVWMLERDSHLAFDHMMSLGQRDARERVAHLLLELAVRSTGRLPAARGEVFKIPLNQPLIAEATGLTSIHVNRMLRKLREDDILDFHHGRLTVFDPERLVELAGVSEAMLALWSRASQPMDEALSA
ncbi:Crp/Fnr family transcriptional regulator [Phenylobacterium montanum]|uniref:Crp/Fnr family transcriptional regulator n=1 Tax=Phenylobacterium montanum TaxID=2823693 RepID=A0A975G071_9CAUL|nr:Crp/Fnr family transcriptional regulator [Caulobacter sp. S6]QUD88685.1 Crp/Fnr family transcriptional regulator [Caulobacter sp. S6]